MSSGKFSTKNKRNGWRALAVFTIMYLVIVKLNGNNRYKRNRAKGEEVKTESENGRSIINLDINNRAQELTRDNVKILYSIVKAVTMGLATIVLLNLLASSRFFSLGEFTFENNINILYLASELICWATSCLLMILTYDAAMYAGLFLVKPNGLLEIVIIFTFVGFEFSLFQLLNPEFINEKIDSAEPFNAISCWFLMHGIYTFFIGLFCLTGISHVTSADYGDRRINGILLRHFSKDFKETITVGAASVVSAFIPTIAELSYNYLLSNSYVITPLSYEVESRWLSTINVVLASCFLAILILANRWQHEKRWEMYNHLGIVPNRTSLWRSYLKARAVNRKRKDEKKAGFTENSLE